MAAAAAEAAATDGGAAEGSKKKRRVGGAAGAGAANGANGHTAVVGGGLTVSEASSELVGHLHCVSAVAWPSEEVLYSGGWDHSVSTPCAVPMIVNPRNLVVVVAVT